MSLCHMLTRPGEVDRALKPRLVGSDPWSVGELFLQAFLLVILLHNWIAPLHRMLQPHDSTAFTTEVVKTRI